MAAAGVERAVGPCIAAPSSVGIGFVGLDSSARSPGFQAGDRADTRASLLEQGRQNWREEPAHLAVVHLEPVSLGGEREGFSKGLRTLESESEIRFQSPGHGVVDLLRDLGAQVADSHRALSRHLEHDGRVVHGFVQALPGEAPGHDSGSPYVGTPVTARPGPTSDM
jgi:hypothetical protein